MDRTGVRALDRRSALVFGTTGALSVTFLLFELGAAALLVAAVAALVLLPLSAGAVLLLDRVQPEPRAVLAWTFCAGATAVLLLALVVNSVADVVLTLAAGLETSELVTSSVVAPLVEEGGKAAVLVVLLRRNRTALSGPLDGVVYAAAVGLGFAVVEDVLYYGYALHEGTLAETVLVRGVLSPLAHPLFTAFTGIGLGLVAARRTRWTRGAPALGFVVAVALHAAWNGSSYVADGAGTLVVLPLVMLPALVGVVVLCRRESRRERALIRHHLAAEVAAGLLAPADVEALADVRLRSHLRRAVDGAGGDGRLLVATALALVEQRDRLSRAPAEPGEERELAALTERLVAAGRPRA